jgi:hypothetical protein
LKEEALDHALWRTRFGRGYEPVVRQTTEWMNEVKKHFLGAFPRDGRQRCDRHCSNLASVEVNAY